MGKHFGNLQKLKGVTYYTLSPMEINPMMMMVSGLTSAVRKFMRGFLIGVVPCSMGAYTYYWATTTYHHSLRKNPDDYKDDV